MNGYDIRNAMNKAYGISAFSEERATGTFEAREGGSSVRRLVVALAMTLKGWVL